MERKLVLMSVIVILLTSLLSVTFRIEKVQASGTIYIRADGSIDPPTANITTADNVTYTFTDNNYDSIVVERDNILLDGQGNLLQGTGSGYGITLSGRSNVTLRNIEINAFYIGVRLDHSSYNTVSGNTITNNGYGVALDSSSGNSVSGNNITANNDYGIYLIFSSSNNSISVNNITAHNLWGIFLSSSSSNIISGNNIANNLDGVKLYSSSSNSIIGNNITANGYQGIVLDYSTNSSISGNNIANNGYGICLSGSSDNLIFHNNFIGNTQQVSTSASTNVWDNGYPSGGNYWSNYTGTDSDHDGIGDSHHVIASNNTDYYPLMGMFSSFNTSLGKHVNVISNSTDDDFEYSESSSSIEMYVSNMTENQTHGFCRVCIPKDLISPPYNVTINDGAITVLHFNGSIHENATHQWIYFAYEHSTLEIVIIPEFQSLAVLPLFMFASLLAVLVYKRKRAKV